MKKHDTAGREYRAPTYHDRGAIEHGVSYMAIARAWLVSLRENPKALYGAVLPHRAHRKLGLLGATRYEQLVAWGWVQGDSNACSPSLIKAARGYGEPLMAKGRVLPAEGKPVQPDE